MSFATDYELVGRMTELEILRGFTGFSRDRRFRYEGYVNPFTGQPGVTA